MAEHRDKTPENGPYSVLKRYTASVAVLAAAATLGACRLQEPTPLPGERLGLVRITTVPPGLIVRTISQGRAQSPAQVQKWGPTEKIGPSPLEVSVSYQPGFETQLTVHGFLKNPPEPGTPVTLSCEVEADGELLPGAEDVEVIDETNMQTGFVLCAFNENLAPPLSHR